MSDENPIPGYGTLDNDYVCTFCGKYKPGAPQLSSIAYSQISTQIMGQETYNLKPHMCDCK